MKNYLSINYQDKVLSKIISLSDPVTGQLDYSKNIIDSILTDNRGMSIDILFHLLYILSDCGYIDISYLDCEKHTFQTIFIQAHGYNYVPRKKNDSLKFWIPLIVSILALLRPEIIKFIEWIFGLFSQK